MKALAYLFNASAVSEASQYLIFFGYKNYCPQNDGREGMILHILNYFSLIIFVINAAINKQAAPIKNEYS